MGLPAGWNQRLEIIRGVSPLIEPVLISRIEFECEERVVKNFYSFLRFLKLGEELFLRLQGLA